MKTNVIFQSSVEKPIYTIGIPTYKRANLLNEAVCSALDQDTKIQYDILVVDNNPERNDETELMMQKFDKGKITYCKHYENLGMVGNFNSIFDLAKGELIIMLHDDDLLLPNYLSVMHNFRINTGNRYSLIFPGYIKTYDRTYNHVSYVDFTYRKLSVFEFSVENSIGPPVGMLVSKDAFKSAGGFTSKYYPSIDEEFYINVLMKYDGCKIDAKLALYCWGENESLKEETVVGFFKNTRDINRYLCEILPPVQSALCKWVYRNSIRRVTTSLLNDVSEEYVNKGLLSIGFVHNKIKDFLSLIIAKLILLKYRFFRRRYYKFDDTETPL